MKLVYTYHLKTRLKQRGIPLEIVKTIFKINEQSFWDNLRNHHIVVSNVVYKGKKRNVLAAYDKIGDKAEVITIHPISRKEITQRIKSRRWTYEKTNN